MSKFMLPRRVVRLSSFAQRQFWNRSQSKQEYEIAKYIKDPKAFKELGKPFEQEKTREEVEFDKVQEGLKQIAHSKKNMKIDMRPKVLVRTMYYELLFFAFGMTMVVGLPLYFYKIKPMQDAAAEKTELKLQQKREQDHLELIGARREYSKQHYKDFNLSTQDKMARFTPEEIQKQTAQIEQEYEREVLRLKRQERMARAERKKQREAAKQQKELKLKAESQINSQNV